MALVLAMRANESFFANGAEFTLTRISSDREFVLRRCSDSKDFVVTEGRSQEIAPDIRVSVGFRSQLELSRVAIEAPRSIRIVREGMSP